MYVVLTFRENGRTNPTKDKDMELGWILHQLFQAFKSKDPKVAQQKAVPILALSELWKQQNTKTEKALAQLTVAAYYLLVNLVNISRFHKTRNIKPTF